MTILREVKKETKRRMILSAAIALFSKKGFDKVTVDDITRRAKVAKGAFYNFFTKKENVLLFFVDQEIQRSREISQFKLAEKNNFLDQTEELLKGYLKHVFNRKDFAKVLVRERIMKMGTKKNLNELKVLDTFIYIVNLAKQRNEIKKTVDSRKIAELMNCINTFYLIFWLNGTFKSKEECLKKIKEALAILLEGIGTSPQKPEYMKTKSRANTV